ncbi:MAG: PEP-CTERM sorting domain-containing protein [Chthoniobacterales bacterium]
MPIKSSRCVLLCLFAIAFCAAPLSAATLQGDYQLQDVYTSSAPPIGPLVPTGVISDQMFGNDTVMGVNQRVLQFTGVGDQHGVQTQTNPFVSSSDYSLVLLASFTLSPTGAVATKVFDFQNLSMDAGLYIDSTTGLLSFNGVMPTPPIGGTPVVSGQYTQVVLTRDGMTGLVSVYQAGVLAFSFSDTSNLAVLGDATASGNSFLTVFSDDNANVGGTTTESTIGNVARLRLYNGALTASEVMGLDTTVVPEPATWALLLGGTLALGWELFRRRRPNRI